MEFKAVRLELSKTTIIVDAQSKTIAIMSEGKDTKKNSLLFEKAPEMLDMLKDSVEVIKWYMENSTTELHEPFFNIGANQIEQTGQLIKQATEL